MKYKYILIILLSCGCSAVKPHEMVFLNDREMQMGNSGEKNFENYIESIREGSSPTGTGKASGGCGCN